MEAWARADGVPWTLTHAYYANMGGFTFKVEGQPFKPYALGPANGSTISLVSLQRIYNIIKNRSKTTLQSPENIHVQNDCWSLMNIEYHFYGNTTDLYTKI
jgi:hypothetical protein